MNNFVLQSSSLFHLSQPLSLSHHSIFSTNLSLTQPVGSDFLQTYFSIQRKIPGYRSEEVPIRKRNPETSRKKTQTSEKNPTFSRILRIIEENRFSQLTSFVSTHIPLCRCDTYWSILQTHHEHIITDSKQVCLFIFQYLQMKWLNQESELAKLECWSENKSWQFKLGGEKKKKDSGLWEKKKKLWSYS